jgi:DNA-binding NtrC family response regulator
MYFFRSHEHLSSEGGLTERSYKLAWRGIGGTIEMSKTVLIIDDDGAVASELGATICSRGYVAEYRTRGEELAEIAKRSHTAAILLNVTQSGAEGLKVLDVLKQGQG